ncbi:hypothetical protein JF818_09995 [Sphaerochaeta sp. S2]|nr:hypothetical protein [Sphaerochaeta sp. S2]
MNWKEIGKIDISMDKVLDTRADVFSYNNKIIVNEVNEIALYDHDGNLIERKGINTDSSTLLGMENYFAVVDNLQGNIYILDYYGGYVGEVNHLGPIEKAVAANNDVFVVITADNHFLVFDYEGNEISNIQLSSGRLLGLDISKDKKLVLVTLLSSDEKKYNSKLITYSLDTNSMLGAHNNYNSIVYGARIYDQVILIVDFNGLHAYMINEENSFLWERERTGSLINFEIDENGNVYEINERKEVDTFTIHNLVCINKDGKEIFTKELDEDYRSLSLKRGQILLVSDFKILILNSAGEEIQSFESNDRVMDAEWLSENRILVEYNNYIEILELAY